MQWPVDVTEARPQKSQINAETAGCAGAVSALQNLTAFGPIDQNPDANAVGVPSRAWAAWEVFLEESNVLVEVWG